MTTTNSPQDIVLPRPEWSIGPKLGEGAQGSVYAIVVNPKKKKQQDDETSWAMKVTRKPPPTKTKSKKHATARSNASSLNKEALLYNAHLKPLRGTVIPNVPSDCQGLRESNGFQFIVMQRMECELFGDLEELQLALQRPQPRSSNKKTSLNVGPLAQALLRIVEEIHGCRQLMIDVKPENFMFACQPSKKRKDKNSHLLDRLRLVDFGLMKPFQRPEPVGSLQGNAMYASLHMHTLQNSSRRDDVEMVLYVIAEAVIRLNAIGNDDDDYSLPWSRGATSDDDIFAKKKKHVLNRTSEFYQLMPEAAANAIFAALQEVWSYDFNACPDYEGLQERLAQLGVTVAKQGSKKKPPAKNKTTTTTTPPRRRRRTQPQEDVVHVHESDESSDEEEVEAWSATKENNGENFRTLRSGRKVQNTPQSKAPSHKRDPANGSNNNREKEVPLPKRRARASKQERSYDHGGPTKMEVDEIYGGSEDSSSDDDNDADEEMVDQEQVDPTTKMQSSAIVRMIVYTQDDDDNDGKPQEYTITGDEQVCIGSNPLANNKKKERATFVSTPGADGQHCNLSLFIKRGRAIHVKVKDLNSTSKTFLVSNNNLKPIKKGAEAACVIPGEIALGDTVRIEFLRG